MIDTQEKLDAFVEQNRTHMVEKAVKELNERPWDQEPDIWVSFWLTHEEQCDINIYEPEDGHINITAYALRELGADELQVNTEIGVLVADIKWEE